MILRSQRAEPIKSYTSCGLTRTTRSKHLRTFCALYIPEVAISIANRGHGDEINQVRCNATGTRIATCSDDMTARVWNVEDIFSSADSIPGLVASNSFVVLAGHRHSVSTIGWCSDISISKHPMVAT